MMNADRAENLDRTAEEKYQDHVGRGSNQLGQNPKAKGKQVIGVPTRVLYGREESL